MCDKILLPRAETTGSSSSILATSSRVNIELQIMKQIARAHVACEGADGAQFELQILCMTILKRDECARALSDDELICIHYKLASPHLERPL